MQGQRYVKHYEFWSYERLFLCICCSLKLRVLIIKYLELRGNQIIQNFTPEVSTFHHSVNTCNINSYTNAYAMPP